MTPSRSAFSPYWMPSLSVGWFALVLPSVSTNVPTMPASWSAPVQRTPLPRGGLDVVLYVSAAGQPLPQLPFTDGLAALRNEVIQALQKPVLRWPLIAAR